MSLRTEEKGWRVELARHRNTRCGQHRCKDCRDLRCSSPRRRWFPRRPRVLTPPITAPTSAPTSALIAATLVGEVVYSVSEQKLTLRALIAKQKSAA
jgi:hypothetical protein